MFLIPFRRCQTWEASERKESEIMICCCYYYLQRTFFCCYSININELRKNHLDWEIVIVGRRERDNIKCNIFNEKWLIFLFVTSMCLLTKKKAEMKEFCWLLCHGFLCSLLAESIYSKRPSQTGFSFLLATHRCDLRSSKSKEHPVE